MRAKPSAPAAFFIDYLRNDQTASAIATYSTRAREGAPIAVPLTWRELTALQNAHSFTIASVLRRKDKFAADPWKHREFTAELARIAG